MASLRYLQTHQFKNEWWISDACGRSLAASGYIIVLSGMALTRIDLLPHEDLIHILKHDITHSEELRWIFKNLSQAGESVKRKGPAGKGQVLLTLWI